MNFLNKQTHSYTFMLMIACLLMGWIGLSNQASAQVLDANSRVGIVLDDGTQVILYAKASSINRNRKPGSKADDYYNEENSGQYYYLPTNLRLSAREDGTPEFLFLKYTTDEKASAGGVQGALMHFLMEWGLTPAQEDELQKKLVQKLNEIKGRRRSGLGYSSPKGGNKMAKVMGPANLRSDTEESFRIISGTLSNKDFTPALVTTGRAPLLPGSKIAVGTILEKNGAQLLAATFEKNRSITDVSINLRFRYDVLMPAVDGRIVVHWERIDSLYQEYKRDYKHEDKDDGTMPKFNSLGDDVITDSIKDSLFVSMTESNAVTIQLDNLQPDNPIAQEVTKAFMDYFLSSITEKEFIQMDAPKAYDPSDGYQPSEDLYEYHMNMEKFENKIARKTETYDLMVRLPITQEFTLTENLASWYDGVKHNEACVSSVNLNDPFFQHRDLNFILDLEAKEMFDQEVNYVYA